MIAPILPRVKVLSLDSCWGSKVYKNSNSVPGKLKLLQRKHKFHTSAKYVKIHFFSTSHFFGT